MTSTLCDTCDKDARYMAAKAENAELRDLVRFMWFADYAGHFSTLPEHQEHKSAVWQRMCKLGIEVEQ